MPFIHIYIYGGFLKNRGTPSSHPFIDGIFHYKRCLMGYPHDLGNLHISIPMISASTTEICADVTWLTSLHNLEETKSLGPAEEGFGPGND